MSDSVTNQTSEEEIKRPKQKIPIERLQKLLF